MKWKTCKNEKPCWTYNLDGEYLFADVWVNDGINKMMPMVYEVRQQIFFDLNKILEAKKNIKWCYRIIKQLEKQG